MHIGTCDICEAKDVAIRFTACHGIETWICEEGCKIHTHDAVTGEPLWWVKGSDNYEQYTNPLAPEKANPYNNVDKGYVR